LQFNPLFDAKIIERQIASDPQLYRAEYLSEWRDDLSSFLSRDLLEAAVDVGVLVRPPTTDTKYFAFADPSGGSHDSFTLAVSHRDRDGSIVLDLLYERHAPFNPSQAVAEIAALLKTYSFSHVVGDKYAAKWVVEAFAKVGISYRHSDADRSAVYLDCLPLFTSGRARLIDNARLISQFAGLERRTFPTGRDRVNHGRGGHDDAANSVAGALVLAARPAVNVVPMVGALILSQNAGWSDEAARPRSAHQAWAQQYYGGGVLALSVARRLARRPVAVGANGEKGKSKCPLSEKRKRSSRDGGKTRSPRCARR
jgi:hypothetical protein